jgi:F-type H+-transporting ATPase subunit b
MLIDWFTVGAQVLNFLILVWLLRRFLYHPILNAIDAREQRIAAELADAAAKQAEALKERNAFRDKNAAFDHQHAERMNTLAREVETERRRLLEEARQAAEALTAKRQRTLADEARTLDRAVAQWAQKEVFALARKALSDLGGASLESQVADVFVRRLRALDGEAKTTLAKALAGAATPAVVRSAFDLPAGQQTSIRDAVQEVFGTEVRVTFETAPDLISGIELLADGQKVAWTLSDYLGALESGVGGLLAQRDKPATVPAVTPGNAAAVGP